MMKQLVAVGILLSGLLLTTSVFARDLPFKTVDEVYARTITMPQIKECPGGTRVVILQIQAPEGGLYGIWLTEKRWAIVLWPTAPGAYPDHIWAGVFAGGQTTLVPQYDEGFTIEKWSLPCDWLSPATTTPW